MGNEDAKCFVCGCGDQTPLIALTFNGRSLWICPTDMPRLIHDSATLADDLAAAS